MKSLKRVFALAVVFAMVLASMPAVMAATTFEDVTGADQNVVGTLVGLNIITGYDEDGTMLFKGDQTITRAEFATIVCRLIGMGDAAASQRDTAFTDVPSTHWASGYIQTAADTNGIINGYGDGTFGPEDNVTYEQAVKMIVCALGYQTKAEEEGTYPAGYIFVARTIGLTDGVTGSVGQEASRMTVAKLLYNSLNTPLMQKIVSGTTSSYYGIFDGEEYTPKKTVLSEYLSAVKVTGVLSNTSISTESLREDQVQIDITDNFGSRVAASNESYAEGETITCYVGDSNAKSLLGKQVEAYLTFETSANNDPTVLAIFENTNENKKLSIEFDDIREMTPVEGANGTVTSYAVKYWTDKDNNKSTTVYVSANAAYYLNGAKDSNFKTATLADAVAAGQIANGDKYTVIDFSLVGKTTGDYDYDNAFIKVYENFVVDSIDEVAEKVYEGLDTASIGTLDYSDDADYEVSITDANGAAVSATDLAEYDVLTMQINPYNWKTTSEIKAISAVLVQDSIEGTVTELNDAEGEYYIDGEVYDIDPASTLNIALGDTGTFYLDANGNIVAFNLESSKNNNYAVIVKKAIAGDIDSSYQVKMFTSAGSLEVRDLADKVRNPQYDGSKTSTSSLDNDVAYANIPTLPAVCSYSLNSAGEINSLSFATDTYRPSAPGAAKSSALVANSLNYANGEVEAERMDVKRVDAGTKYFMDENTKIIALDSTANLDSVVIDDFELYTADSFTADQKFDRVSVYDANTSNYAGFVFLYDDEISLSSDAVDLAMVKSVNDVNNAEGDPTAKITAINRDGATSNVIDADYNDYSLTAGEVYYAKSANANGELKKLVKVTERDGNVFKLNSDFVDTEYANMVANDSDSTFYYGKVINKSKTTIEFENLLDNNELEAIQIPNATQVMVYDQSRSTSNRVTSATASYMTFETRPYDYDDNGDPMYRPSADGIECYYVLIREYNGQILDVVYYCYTTDVNQTLDNTVIEDDAEDVTTEAVEDAIIVDEIDKIKEDVIAE